MDEININNDAFVDNTSVDILKNSCFKTITDLCELYKNNQYILNRINTHINTSLSPTLENELKNFQERTERFNMLTNEQKNFIEVFLNRNRYYYLPSSESFYKYNFNQYNGHKCFDKIREDDIIHELLSEISNKRVLLDWKHKTKQSVMKLIKERNLFTCTPETETIQSVLNILCPLIFSTKDEAKYFLTICGDNILKKQTNLIFLVNNQTKRMMIDVEEYTNYRVGINNICNNFMTKYHENHNYDMCRFLNSNQQYNSDLFKDQLLKFGLNIICVAVHYSKRYDNSDGYLDNKAYNNLRSYAYYLRDNKIEEIVTNKFSNKYIQDCDPNNGCSLSWKKIHYVWKTFLSNSNYPNFIYSNNLKNILKTKYQYDEGSDSFLNIATSFLPNVSEFIKFWEANIISTDKTEDNMNEFEIDEICTLFKYWKKNNGLSQSVVNENEAIQIIKHFFSSVEIIEDKYITNIKSGLIDKQIEIKNSLDKMKIEFGEKNDEQNGNGNSDSIISFDTAYSCYENYMKQLTLGTTVKMIVSKRYFENYLLNNLKEFIKYDKFISYEWYKK